MGHNKSQKTHANPISPKLCCCYSVLWVHREVKEGGLNTCSADAKVNRDSLMCSQNTPNQAQKSIHACLHSQTNARTHMRTLFFLPPCTASSESSLYSRHREMSAPCDRPVSSSHADLCGTLVPCFSSDGKTMYSCSPLGTFPQLIMESRCGSSVR